MTTKNKVTMVKVIKTILGTISVLSFIYALGIVGNVENGGNILQMLWTIPLCALSFITGYIAF